MTITSQLPAFVTDPLLRLGNNQHDAKPPLHHVLLLPGYAAAQPTDDGAPGDGASLTVVGQAYVFTPPPEADAIGPYRGPFAVFRPCRLNEDQERLLVERGYYFKGIPYAGDVNVQVAFDSPSPPVTNSNAASSGVQQLETAWCTAVTPLTARPNGFVKINHTWTDAPRVALTALQERSSSTGPPARYRLSVPTTSSNVDYDPLHIASEQPQATEQVLIAPFTGRHIAIISDIDDVLKDTQVSIHPRQALIDTFTREYEPLPGTVQLFQDLQHSATSTATHVTFHYISGTPIPLAPALLPFLKANYPPGSLTLRPVTSFDFESVSNLLTDALENEYRYNAICEILNTFPNAVVVLFGDTSKHAFQTYLRLVKEFPDRIKCLYIRKLGKHPLRIGGDEARLTQEKMIELVRDRLPLEMWGRAERMALVYGEATELAGKIDWLFP